MNRFKEGRDITKSDKRKCRPVTVLNERKVAEIQEYNLEDRRVTVENVAEHFGIRMVQLRILSLTSLESDVFRRDECRTCCFRNRWG